MFTETFYVALAFVAFFVILFKAGVHKTLIAAIDNRAVQIQAELDEAKRLNQEAQALLVSITARKQAAEEEAKAIVSEANEEAKRIAADSKLKVEEFIARRAKQAEMKIAQAEAQAIQDVREGAADLATNMASHLLAGEVSNANLITQGISQVRTQMN